MKQNVFYLGIILSTIISSCHDEIIPLQDNSSNINSLEKELICYPKRKSALYSRGESFESDWEKWEKVTLPSGDSVYTPWNPSMSGTDIPIEIRQDIKKINGWELIAHTMKGYGEKGMNYLIFHNRYTGLLKVFYYLERDNGQLQNTGIWNLHFEAPQSFLNFTTDFAQPASVKDNSDFYVGNITNNKSKGFTLGWNCFQVELAYDPDFTSIPLQIIPYNMSVSDIKFDGTFESSTNGTIMQTFKKNIFDNEIKSVAGYVGNQAEEWVKEALNKGVFKKISNIIINGAGSIATSGISSLLHSFLGGFDKENSTIQTIQLRTNGTYTMSGQLTKVESGLIIPLSINLSVEKVGKLGAWCLKEEPIFELYPVAHLDLENSEGEEEFLKNYYMESWSFHYNAIMNPDLLSHIKKCEFYYNLYESNNCKHNKSAFEYDNNLPITNIPKSFPKEKKLYDNLYMTSTIPLTIHVGLGPNPPQEVYVLNAPDGSKGAVGNIDMDMFHVASVSMKLTVDINGKENTIISSHLFDINKYQWTPWEDRFKSYWPFKKN